MKPAQLTDLLRSLMRDNPRASQREIHDLCLQRCAKDRRLQLALFEYWFSNSFRDFTIAEYGHNSTAVLSAERSQKTTGKDRQRAAHSLKEQLKACLLDYALSDGTLLRSATFGQCEREGGWLLDISKCGKANEIVGKKLTETNIRDLLARHGKAKAA